LGSDDGYDARGLEITDVRDEPEDDGADDEESSPNVFEDRLWQIQCKREKSITPAKIETYIGEMLTGKNPIPYGVIFAAPCDFSKKTRDAFANKMQENKVQEFYLWGKADLEDMLMQPKNDHLLYAYFGISLVIRRRSLKTQIRSILATKRKAVRYLGVVDGDSYKEVLLRDANDTHYPYSCDVANFEKNRPWKLYYFVGHYHHGIRILVRKFYAYREIDDKTGALKNWDFSEEINIAAPHDDPWNKEEKKADGVYAFWSKIGKSNQAYFEYVRFIPYERIIEIDHIGDGIAKCPHIFVVRKGGCFFEDYGDAFLRSPEHWGYFNALQAEDSKLKKNIFPEKLPEVKEESPNTTGVKEN